jgi:hypothetical protein
MSSMRLSVKKAAHADLSRAAYRKSAGILGALLLHANALARPSALSAHTFSAPLEAVIHFRRLGFRWAESAPLAASGCVDEASDRAWGVEL